MAHTASWAVRANEGDGAYRDAFEPVRDEDLIPVQLAKDTAPIMSTAELVARAARLDRFRAACRDIYSFVDEIDSELRETGECSCDPQAIVDEVKRLISRAYL
jgi:hypothetical protein